MARVRLTSAGCSLLASPRSKNRRKPPCRMFRIATRTIVTHGAQVLCSVSGRSPLATAKYGVLRSIAAAGGLHSNAVSHRKRGIWAYQERWSSRLAPGRPDARRPSCVWLRSRKRVGSWRARRRRVSGADAQDGAGPPDLLQVKPQRAASRTPDRPLLDSLPKAPSGARTQQRGRDVFRMIPS